MVEILVKGRRGSKVIPLVDDRPLVIGRNGRLRIDDQQISRKHARVIRRENAWYVEDLGSTNGTYVNRVRVIHTERVEPGDCIRIGNTSMIVRQAAPSAGDTAIFVPPRRRPGLQVPNRIEPAQTALSLPPAHRGDATRNSWGPMILIAMVLALVVSVVVNVIAYARTASALRDMDIAGQRRAAERDVDLVAALRSDLRKPPAGLAELAAVVEDALQPRADQASPAEAVRADELVVLHQSTIESLAEIRRKLDGLASKLDSTDPSMPLSHGEPTSAPAQAGLAAATFAKAPYAAPASNSANGFKISQTDSMRPDVVFIIDASRGLAATIPQVLAQVRMERSDLAPYQTSRLFIARENTVTEVPDSSVMSMQAAEALAEDAGDGDSASVSRAIAMALELHPRRLHLFTDNADDPAGTLRNALAIAASRGTSLSVTHFYTREFREDLKSLARDNGGMYSFVGPR